MNIRNQMASAKPRAAGQTATVGEISAIRTRWSALAQTAHHEAGALPYSTSLGMSAQRIGALIDQLAGLIADTEELRPVWQRNMKALLDVAAKAQAAALGAQQEDNLDAAQQLLDIAADATEAAESYASEIAAVTEQARAAGTTFQHMLTALRDAIIQAAQSGLADARKHLQENARRIDALLKKIDAVQKRLEKGGDIMGTLEKIAWIVGATAAAALAATGVTALVRR